jgi:hypothetical protein
VRTTGEQAVTLYDGVINLDDNQISVIIGFENAGIRMSSGGSEIGEWAEGEYSIDHNGGGVYTITAESEALQFVPNNPRLFAARLNGEVAPNPEPVAEHSETESVLSEAVEELARPENRDEAPPPKPMTMVIFYALTGVTVALGLWAVVSLFTG